MRLEIGTFPVKDVVFGKRNSWEDGVLEVDRSGLLNAIARDMRIESADLHLARPGESVRITKVRDVIEPRVKVQGPGVAYPGVCGRPVTTVGMGRTHRLQGVAVVESADVEMYEGYDAAVETFLDMSGPAASLTPFGSTLNLCLVLEPDRRISIYDQNEAIHAASLLVSDRLAETVKGLEPPQLETYELGEVDPSLPRVVYIWCMRSSEHYSHSLYAHWTAIYGITRLTPPWALHPNEVLDGAISNGSPYHGVMATSWVYVNNPVVLSLYAEHGKSLNFAGCITIRTRWTSQAEKDVTSQQAAKLAYLMGAKGAIISWDSGGNDFMETIRTVQACEKIGIKTVFLTGEESPSSGGPPLLEPLPEADAIVSTGSRYFSDEGASAIPAVERMIGKETIAANLALPKTGGQISAKGPLSSFRGRDIYGFGRNSCFGY